MKKILVLGIIAMGMLYACSNEDDQDLSSLQKNKTVVATGGEQEQTPPPPKTLP